MSVFIGQAVQSILLEIIICFCRVVALFWTLKVLCRFFEGYMLTFTLNDAKLACFGGARMSNAYGRRVRDTRPCIDYASFWGRVVEESLTRIETPVY